MNSKLLSLRSRQPGHDRSFRESEENFVAALRKILDPAEWEVEDHPNELRKIFDGQFGVVPEASIRYLPNGRILYFEVKKQGPAGNAEERAYKHHTVQFYKVLHEVTGLPYHPFVTILCESLATLPRYTIKTPFFIEEDHFLEWENYDLDLLTDFLARVTTRWMIEGFEDPAPTIVPD